jgi:hypothetical protein
VLARLSGTVPYRLYAGLGALSWATVLAFARAFPGWFDGEALTRLMLYGAAALLAIGAVLLIRSVLRPERLVEAIGTAAAVALVLDGLTLAVLPVAYGGNAVAREAGAFLLFGTGAFLTAAILLEHRRLGR